MKDRTAINMAVRLIEETTRNNLQWQISDVPRSLKEGSGSIHPLFVESHFKGNRIALYEERYRHFTDEDTFFWSTRVCLAILDDQDRVLWEAWDEAEINELFQYVRQSVAGVSTLLNYFR